MLTYTARYHRWFSALVLALLTIAILFSAIAAQVRANSPSSSPDGIDSPYRYALTINDDAVNTKALSMPQYAQTITCDPQASIQLGSVSSAGIQNDVSGNLNSSQDVNFKKGKMKKEALWS